MKSDGTSPNHTGKYYGVRSGRVPGVYTDWPSAQQQITGWSKPKHKAFSTRAEAEAFVRGTLDTELSTPTTDGLPPSKKSKTTAKKDIAAQTEKELASMTGEPILAPLPIDAEDGFDHRQIMDLETGAIRWKTVEELSATKLQFKPDNYADSLKIWTDGACRGNGKARAYAGVGVWFGAGDERCACSSFIITSTMRLTN
jgi:ribonuclease HI